MQSVLACITVAFVSGAELYSHLGITYTEGYLVTALYANADCSDDGSNLYYWKNRNLAACSSSFTKMLVNLENCEEFVVAHYSSSDCATSSIVSYSQPMSTSSSLDPTRSFYNTCSVDTLTGNKYKQWCSAAVMEPSFSLFGTDYFTETVFSPTEASACSSAATVTATHYYSSNKCFHSGSDCFRIVNSGGDMVVETFAASNVCDGGTAATLLFYSNTDSCEQFETHQSLLTFHSTPSAGPTAQPTTHKPTLNPTAVPSTAVPTTPAPTPTPGTPTLAPITSPTPTPTVMPSVAPGRPTPAPSVKPSAVATPLPSATPTLALSDKPSTKSPVSDPTLSPQISSMTEIEVQQVIVGMSAFEFALRETIAISVLKWTVALGIPQLGDFQIAVRSVTAGEPEAKSAQERRNLEDGDVSTVVYQIFVAPASKISIAANIQAYMGSNQFSSNLCEISLEYNLNSSSFCKTTATVSILSGLQDDDDSTGNSASSSAGLDAQTTAILTYALVALAGMLLLCCTCYGLNRAYKRLTVWKNRDEVNNRDHMNLDFQWSADSSDNAAETMVGGRIYSEKEEEFGGSYDATMRSASRDVKSLSGMGHSSPNHLSRSRGLVPEMTSRLGSPVSRAGFSSSSDMAGASPPSRSVIQTVVASIKSLSRSRDDGDGRGRRDPALLGKMEVGELYPDDKGNASVVDDFFQRSLSFSASKDASSPSHYVTIENGVRPDCLFEDSD